MMSVVSSGRKHLFRRPHLNACQERLDVGGRPASPRGKECCEARAGLDRQRRHWECPQAAFALNQSLARENCWVRHNALSSNRHRVTFAAESRMDPEMLHSAAKQPLACGSHYALRRRLVFDGPTVLPPKCF